MELIYALLFPIILLSIFTIFFSNKNIPDQIQRLINNEANIWNFGVILIGTVSIIVYLANQNSN